MRAENYLNSPMNENEAQSLNGRKLCENILEIKEILDKVKTGNILKLQDISTEEDPELCLYFLIFEILTSPKNCSTVL